MQDEVNEKTISLCIKGGKISAEILKGALKKLLAEWEKQKQKAQSGKTVIRHGKQSLKSLQLSGAQLTNIVVTDSNIRSFDRVARKYGIDYSLKRDDSETPPKYLVFFRAKDVDVMTAAFREYSGVVLKKTAKKDSILEKLEKVKQRAPKHRERSKEKQKDRGQTR